MTERVQLPDDIGKLQRKHQTDTFEFLCLNDILVSSYMHLNLILTNTLNMPFPTPWDWETG